MSRAVRRVNFRVEVTPRAAGDVGVGFVGGRERKENEAENICEQIASEIRRHVDDLPSRFMDSSRGVHVIWDREPVCGHCGNAWTEASDTYNGGCCSKDDANNPHPDQQP